MNKLKYIYVIIISCLLFFIFYNYILNKKLYINYNFYSKVLFDNKYNRFYFQTISKKIEI